MWRQAGTVFETVDGLNGISTKRRAYISATLARNCRTSFCQTHEELGLDFGIRLLGNTRRHSGFAMALKALLISFEMFDAKEVHQSSVNTQLMCDQM